MSVVAILPRLSRSIDIKGMLMVADATGFVGALRIGFRHDALATGSVFFREMTLSLAVILWGGIVSLLMVLFGRDVVVLLRVESLF